MGRRLDYVKKGLLKGYKFDGCTKAPDFNAEDCCNRHDYDYQNMSMSRAKADKRLRVCLQKKGWGLLAWWYWAVVRALGRNHFKERQNESKVKFQTDLIGPSSDGP